MYKWFYLGGILGFLILAVILCANVISYHRIDSWLERAKDAGNPVLVSEFLTEYKSALIDRNLIANKYYSFWKYPATRMDIYVRVIDALIGRANDLALQSPTDTTFQLGLTNLEKDLGDIDARAFSVWLASGGVFVDTFTVVLFFYVAWGWIPFLYSRL